MSDRNPHTGRFERRESPNDLIRRVTGTKPGDADSVPSEETEEPTQKSPIDNLIRGGNRTALAPENSETPEPITGQGFDGGARGTAPAPKASLADTFRELMNK